MKWDFIPNLFYDLVGRIVPGGFVIVAGAMVTFGPSDVVARAIDGSIQKALSGFGQLGVAFILSYITGFILAEMAFLSKLYEWLRPYSEEADIEKRLLDHEAIDRALERPSLNLTVKDLPGVYSMYDHLRAVAPDEASRLLKIRGEERLCGIIASGSFILAVVDIIILLTDYSVERLILLPLLLVAIVACIKRGRSSLRFFVRGTSTAWLLRVSNDRHESSSQRKNPAPDLPKGGNT